MSVESDGSKDGLFNFWLSEVDNASGYCRTGLRRELDDLVFSDSDSEYFDGFSD